MILENKKNNQKIDTKEFIETLEQYFKRNNKDLNTEKEISI